MRRHVTPICLLQCAWLLSALVLIDAATVSKADSFPSNNTIRIVVPTGPGSPPDVIGRVIASEISDAKGWRVIVENRPGALQTIGMSDVLKQPADGFSIFPMSLGAIPTPILLPTKGIRLETDFAPVVKIASGFVVLVANPSVPATSVAELVALLKAAPDKFNYSSGGFGTPAHLLGEMFKLHTGVRAIHAPYPQGQQRIADLLTGTTHFSFYNTPAVLDLIATGKLRAIAVTAPKRIPALKDVPTVVEEGFPNLLVEDWVGFAVKSGTPDDIVAQLNTAVNKALTKQKVRDALASAGYEPAGGSSAELGSLIESQVTYWRKIITEAGIKMPQ